MSALKKACWGCMGEQLQASPRQSDDQSRNRRTTGARIKPGPTPFSKPHVDPRESRPVPWVLCAVCGVSLTSCLGIRLLLLSALPGPSILCDGRMEVKGGMLQTRTCHSSSWEEGEGRTDSRIRGNFPHFWGDTGRWVPTGLSIKREFSQSPFLVRLSRHSQPKRRRHLLHHQLVCALGVCTLGSTMQDQQSPRAWPQPKVPKEEGEQGS